MKFSISSKVLYTATSAVSKVISAKNSISILNSFLFDVKDGFLTITASDNENVITSRLELGDSDGEGRFCVDARRVVELLKELPDTGMQFEIDEESWAIKIVCANGVFDLVAVDGREYPDRELINTDDNTVRFTVPTSMILDGIESTHFAVGTDEMRPQMMGILWDIKEDGIIFVATDTRKLVKYESKVAAPGFERRIIMPVKPVQLIKNTFDRDEDVDIVITDNAVQLSNARYTLSCQFIKGNFPPYERVIPKDNPYKVTVDRQQFVNAVRRVGVFVDPSHGLVKCRLNDGVIVMRSQDNNYCSKAEERVVCEYDGQDMVIGFSAPYLIEVASTIPGETMEIKLADPSRPGVFLPTEQAENTELLMLLMPMTVVDF